MDQYDRVARFYPAVLTLLPASFLLAAVLGADAWWKPLLGLAAAAGVPYLLTDLVRARGKSAQEQLYREWFGPPTTDLLRHHPHDRPRHDTGDDRRLRARRRDAVTRLSAIHLPTTELETAQKTVADTMYADAVTLVRRELSDDELVRREVRQYGLWRNLYGLQKPMLITALLVLTACLLLGLVPALSSLRPDSSGSTTLLFVAGAVALVNALVSQFVVTADRVKVVAQEYAEALMQAACARVARHDTTP